jgi:hypothetical protein
MLAAIGGGRDVGGEVIMAVHNIWLTSEKIRALGDYVK